MHGQQNIKKKEKKTNSERCYTALSNKF